MPLSRRSFLLLGASAGAYGLLSKLPLARAADARPHFLLTIHIQPGVDWTYLLDARSPKLTQKNLQQNYLFANDAGAAGVTPSEFTDDKVRERSMVCDVTGSAALRSPLANDLWAAHKDRLSVVNGVYMLRDNAGHAENSAYLLGNTAAGGAPIYPPMVGKRLGGTPLDAVVLRELLQISPPPNNLAGSAELSLGDIGALSQTLATGPQIDETSPTWKYILARADANAMQDGMFAAGAANLGYGLRRAKATGAAFAATSPPAPGDRTSLTDEVRTALTFFSAGVTRVAAIAHTENIDTHDKLNAQKQAGMYAQIAGDLKDAIDLLKTTMFVDAKGNQVPFIDVTTFVISSEFGRTTRALSFPSGSSVASTGTDHNPFTNSALVGGKGIVGGLVVGESDLRDCDDNGRYIEVSGAHRQRNGSLDQVMGKPFDFTTQRVRRDLPDTWSEADYICMPSVTNTILDVFGVPEQDQFKLSGRPAPLLSVLRGGAT
jgi:hypothetical protein